MNWSNLDYQLGDDLFYKDGRRWDGKWDDEIIIWNQSTNQLISDNHKPMKIWTRLIGEGCLRGWRDELRCLWSAIAVGL